MKNKVMVCVTQQKTCERLIQYGNEQIKDKEDELFVIHVVHEKDTFLHENNDSQALEYLFRVSKDSGADLTVIRAKDLKKAIIDFAKDKNITKIVIGKSPDEKNKENSLSKTLSEKLKKCKVLIV